MARVINAREWVAAELGIGHTNYNKLENGNREPSAKELQQLARLFDMTTDQILNFEGAILDKSIVEKITDLQQLPENDKDHIMFTLDALLRDAKARTTYAR